MAAAAKTAQQFARHLFRMSVAGGAVSPDLVGGVLAYIEKHRPANPILILKAYRRLIAAELAKSRAVVEHAGDVSEFVLQSIALALTRKYGRPVAATAQPAPELLAGLRVRVGDDVYECSIAGQLAALAASV